MMFIPGDLSSAAPRSREWMLIKGRTRALQGVGAGWGTSWWLSQHSCRPNTPFQCHGGNAATHL